MWRLGSRGSALARWQADHVRRRLETLGESVTVEILSTRGDQRQDVRLAEIGGKGLFTQALEAALADGRIDLAVHSLKDVPSALDPGFALAAILERDDPRDVLVAAPGATLASLPHGARVATGSLRRQAQALALRPDLRIQPIRGNVDTRLRRWRAGECDALLLAAAGLSRLGLAAAVSEWLDPQRFCPSAGQGALALEAHTENRPALALAGRLHHAATGAAVAAERALLRQLACGCLAPVGAFARCERGEVWLDAIVVSPDGRHAVRAAAHGPIADPEAVGRTAAAQLLAAGAAPILRAAETA
jgi:hydroxymethylbilane synthase